MKSIVPAALAGRLLLVLFVFSGLANLIYQSVWSQYLGLPLGHAAYAQTLVLSIFMGGMALGAWFVSRYTPGWKKLIRGYALVELAIGAVGLSFQGIFQVYTQVSQEAVLPFLDNAALAHAYQWITAACLILPQSLLLGATFPLLSAGYLRIMPRQDGEVLGGLYFTNSLGAAFGALAATFLLLPAFGLPGTVLAAGLLNVLTGLGAWLVSAGMKEGAHALTPAVEEAFSPAVGNRNAEGGNVRRLERILLVATGISGATSFVYELGWVRMLNQVLGSSIHSFELMLTAFILGLAFGGLYVRRCSRKIVDPVRYVGYAQVLMGIAALCSVPVFARSFHWVGWIMKGLAKTENGYTFFELGTAVISLAVMFPAAFFAGMTLPLFTMALLRAGAGERAIGRIYAVNTLGAILGVIAMVHVLIPAMGVRLGFTLAALIDALLGLYLLRMQGPARMTADMGAALAGLLLAAGVSLHFGKVDPVVQASGVFRTGRLLSSRNTSVPFLKDGKTATVAIHASNENESMGIVTNGKPDAALTSFRSPPAGGDEFTMVMLGLMPLIAHPDARDVALIGWGSGLSTHTVLGSSVPKNVDTIEIEEAMYEGARLFGERVERAYADPRSHLRIDDARTFFSTGSRRYDVIVSEPSNPWVSGVANLFTVEFYRFLKHHLKDDGVLVQWLHTYEIDDGLITVMLAAMIGEFPDAEIYQANEGDVLIVAPKTRLLRPFQDAPWRETPLSAELSRVGLGHIDEIALRRIGGGELIRNYVRLFGAQPHSDYFPTVSLNAPRTRFMDRQASFLSDLITNGLPVLDILDCRRPLGVKAQVTPSPLVPASIFRAEALRLVNALKAGRVQDMSEANGWAFSLLRQTPELAAAGQVRQWSAALAKLAKATLGALPAEDLQDIWNPAPAWLPPGALENSPAAALVRAYAAAARRDAQAMQREAEAALALSEAAQLAPQAREHLLTLAMLGALGSGDVAKVREFDGRYTGNMSNDLTLIRAYLLAWADDGAPACAAAR
jgi:predicted membrane-bound spermidine synthase